mmetsp:Transcript_47942/g.111859  ORF Transcript_47942/g.111859 Transcript_47942/m.111859 type:complete len:206 (-) Transcript_47942:402-1019(-)
MQWRSYRLRLWRTCVRSCWKQRFTGCVATWQTLAWVRSSQLQRNARAAARLHSGPHFIQKLRSHCCPKALSVAQQLPAVLEPASRQDDRAVQSRQRTARVWRRVTSLCSLLLGRHLTLVCATSSTIHPFRAIRSARVIHLCRAISSARVIRFGTVIYWAKARRATSLLTARKLTVATSLGKAISLARIASTVWNTPGVQRAWKRR